MTEQKGLLDIIEENAKSPSGELREALALLRCEEHGTEYFKSANMRSYGHPITGQYNQKGKQGM